MTDPDAMARAERLALSAAPLAVAYLLLPIVAATAPGIPGPVPDADAAVWTAMAGFALLWTVWRRMRRRGQVERDSSGRQRIMTAAFLAALACVALGGMWDWALGRAVRIEWVLRWLAEFGPLVHLLLAGLWAWTFGLPTRTCFLLFGGALGALVVADSAAGLVLGPDPAVRVPGGAAWLLTGREPLACLLAVALFSLTRETGTAAKPQPADRRVRLAHRAALVLIVTGLALTFSRTALFAAAFGWLFLGPGSRTGRVALALFLLGCAAVALVTMLPPPPGTATLSGGLLWMAGLERFISTPEALLQMRGLGPFAVSLPVSVAGALGLPAKVHFLFPEEVTSLWLRLLLVWGGFGPVAFALLLLLPSVVRPSRLAAGIMALVLTQGTVYQLFYDPRVSVVLWLALLAGMVRSRHGTGEKASGGGEFALE